MRKVIERIGYEDFEEACHSKNPNRKSFMCPKCFAEGTIDYGGEFSYEGSYSLGLKFKCSACGSVGVEWYVLEPAEIEIVESSSMDFESDELNQPIDENY